MFFWTNDKNSIFLCGFKVLYSLSIFLALIWLFFWTIYFINHLIETRSKKETILIGCEWICERIILIWKKFLKEYLILTLLINLAIIFIVWFYSLFDYENANSFMHVLIKGINFWGFYFSSLSFLVILIKFHLWIYRKKKKLKVKIQY